MFLLSLKAGGTGLNLTAATQVVHFDRWWNPAVEDQATDRAFRIGQKRNVQVRKLVCAGTLEERIDEMIETEACACRTDRRHRRRLDHRDVDRAAPRSHRLVRRIRGRRLMPPRRPPRRPPLGRHVRRIAGASTDGWWPPTSKPIPVEGGLQARSQRGAIGDTWWSQRFISLLESVGIGGRLQRGKRYARTGQVISMDVAAGQVTASVQGSRAKPYKVFIVTKVLSDREWNAAEDVMASSAVFMAKLLAGEMPEEIEEAFAGSSGPLFPESPTTSTRRARARTGRTPASTSLRSTSCSPKPSTATRSSSSPGVAATRRPS